MCYHHHRQLYLTMNILHLTSKSFVLALLLLCHPQRAQSSSVDWDPKVTPYPVASRENVTFSFRSASAGGNVSVPDAYNYFERLFNSSSEEIKSFNDQQDNLTQSYLVKAKDEVDKIQSSIKQAGQFSSLAAPSSYGIKGNQTWIYGINEAGNDQGVYYIATQAELDQGIQNHFDPLPGKILVNESALGPNISTYVQLPFDCSKFSLSVVNDDGTSITYIRNISSPVLKPEDVANHYPETYLNPKGGDIQWHPDSESFFYAYEDEVKNGTSSYFQAHLYYHRLGDDVKNDILVVKPILDHIGGFLHFISYDRKYLFVYTFDKLKLYRSVYAASLDQPISSSMKWLGVQVHSRDDMDFVTTIGTNFYFMTDNATGTIVEKKTYFTTRFNVNFNEAVESTDLQNVPQQSAKREVVIPVPKNANPLVWIGYCIFDEDKIVIPYKINSNTEYYIFNLTSGEHLQDILSGYLNVDYGMSCNTDSSYLFIDIASYAKPHKTFFFKWDEGTSSISSTEIVFESHFEANYSLPNDFKAEEYNATAKDGTEIPYVLVFANGTTLDGSHPALVTFPSAYGDTLYPLYDPFYYSFIHDYAGVWIMPGPRGSRQISEESWHTDGMLDKKQNTLDDVVAVLQNVIDQNYTSAGTLILNVELASATAALEIANQAPEGLLGAIIAKRGFYDLLHLEDSKDAKERIEEFGDPQDPKAFDWLSALSPLQNIKSNKTYPTIVLVQGEDDDDKSEPWQGEKMIAQLQYTLPNNTNPLLLGNFQNDSTEESEAKALAIAVHSLGFHRE